MFDNTLGLITYITLLSSVGVMVSNLYTRFRVRCMESELNNIVVTTLPPPLDLRAEIVDFEMVFCDGFVSQALQGIKRHLLGGELEHIGYMHSFYRRLVLVELKLRARRRGITKIYNLRYDMNEIEGRSPTPTSGKGLLSIFVMGMGVRNEND